MSNARVVITGAPIVVDPDPNVTPPDPDRILVTPIGNRARETMQILFYLGDGTSATISTWFLDETLGDWVLIESGISIAAPLVAAKSDVVPVTVQLFTQVTAVAGAPTRLLGTFI